MSDNKETANIRMKNALCYIPLASFFIHFTETKKTKELKKHIKYWIVLFIAYAILNVLLWIFFGWLVLVIYLGISWFLWYKAYNWDEINIEIIDNLGSNKSDKNKKDSSDKDEDVLNF
jgi:fatty acid desaturase